MFCLDLFLNLTRIFSFSFVYFIITSCFNAKKPYTVSNQQNSLNMFKQGFEFTLDLQEGKLLSTIQLISTVLS